MWRFIRDKRLSPSRIGLCLIDHVDRWFEPPKIVIEQLVPDLTAQQIVDEINTIALSPGAARTSWLHTHWHSMSPVQRLAWAERRKAPLLIIWMRGGRGGFQGLGESLSEALEAIDR